MTKRDFVLAYAALVVLTAVLLWLWMTRQTPPLDAAGLYGTLLFQVLPAALLGIFNRWLTVAIVLLSLTAFMYLSLAVFGGAFG
jgi:hypothetical protein